MDVAPMSAIVHPLSIRSSSLLRPVSSSQALLRHPSWSIYRCYLPVLTGFIVTCRVGPDFQHHFAEAVLQNRTSIGNSAPLSALRVQGSASSPLSTTG